jgi:hypothetical protein
VFGIVVRGDVVYIGGYFTRVGEELRASLASVHVVDAAVSAWNPGATGPVLTMCEYNDTLYVGGRFDAVGGLPRANLAAIDMNGGTTTWNTTAVQVPFFDFLEHRVNSLVRQGSVMYVGGVFNQIAGSSRNSLAALDLSARTVMDWDPHGVQEFVPPSVTALGLSGTSLFVGGSFDSLGGAPLVDPTARLDTRTGLLSTQWGARPNRIIRSFSACGDQLFIGGDFTSLGPLVARHHVAALDATTGQPTAWNPGADVYVQALAVKNGKVYAGGAFSFAGGRARRGLAELDSATGNATDWDPSCNGDVWSLATSGSILYVGGAFGVLGGIARLNAGAFDLDSRELAQWSPDPNDLVSCVLPSVDGGVYLGGLFSRLGADSRTYLAAVDGVTGDPIPWDPRPNSFVEDLAVSDSIVYLCGGFTQVGSSPRMHAAAVSARSGLPTMWRADTEGLVKTVATHDGTVYVGGLFSAIGGELHSNLVAVDAQTGVARDWFAETDLIVWTIEPSEDQIYVGGAFRRAGFSPASLFAGLQPFARARSDTLIGYDSNISELNVTNPALGSTIVRYGLRKPAPVTMKVFDLFGRMVLGHSGEAPEPAGFHLREVPTGGWVPGCYIVTMEGGGALRSRKFVVLR